jgi:hypothetical protein
VENRRRVAPQPRQSTKKPVAIETEAAPIEQRGISKTEGCPTSNGQLHQIVEAAVPIEATVKDARVKPESPVSSMASTRPVGNARITPASHDSFPRVQIGQVNVIIEEARVPSLSPPVDQRRDDSASRSFLRSL